MDIIQLLPDHVANQIAAGEVVQRPASVVKELLENAIDSEANQVSLIVKDAGKSLIQVVDNGKGMSETDARLAFERHATSKINKAEDLFNLQTKGFRGEALASIAAVSQVDLKTKSDTKDIGTHISIEAGELKFQEPCVTKKGTSVAVKNLFYNIPARRKFLKSNTVEQKHIIDEFQRVALAHPDVSFKMIHNSSELFQLPPTNIRQRIVGIMGSKTNQKLVPVDENTELVKLTGFVAKPEFAKRTRGEQFFIVNGRFIKNSYLHHAVTSAFEGLLKDKTIPSYFLYLKVDPQSIDINIHPTKTEIKFEDESAIYAILKSAVKHSLGQFQIAPVLDFDRDAELDTPYEQHKKAIQVPNIDVDRDFNPFEENSKSTSFSNAKRFPSDRKFENSWESLYHHKDEDIQEKHNFEIESSPKEEDLFANSEAQNSANIFQLERKYLVTKTKAGLLIIDQHKAHYRVLYEEMMKSITLSPALSQQLIFPLSLTYGAREFNLLKDLKEALSLTGFMFAKFEANAVEINGIPSHISESEVAQILDELIADFEKGVPNSGFEQNNILAKSLAKNMAIKTGKKLSDQEQMQLVSQLFSTKEPKLTPDNKPVFLTFSATDFDNKFL
ncbi:MAG: DNA mismatch repair endonuclease MutL [Bacteroidota bacterium]